MNSKLLGLSLACCVLFSSTVFATEQNKGEKSSLVSTVTQSALKSNSTIPQKTILQVGKVNKIKKGAEFSVVLDENKSTGYLWSFKDSSNAFKLLDEKSILKNENLIGSTSTKTWTFKANKAGTFKLIYSNARPWDKNSTIKTVAYVIEVKSDAVISQKTVLKVGKINKIKIGSEFSVVLEENASTGYSWAFKDTNNAFNLINEKSIVKNKNLMGSPSTKTWTFKAVKEGTFKLIYCYARPWDKNSTIKTVEYVINVTSANSKQ